MHKEELIKGTKHKYYNIQAEFNKLYDLWHWVTKVDISPTSFFVQLKILFLFDISLHINRKEDHAGLYFSFSLLWFDFFFQIYDNRHWCDKCDKFMEEICYKENHNDYPEPSDIGG